MPFWLSKATDTLVKDTSVPGEHAPSLMQRRSSRWVQREAARGLHNNQFHVAYQPIVELATGCVVGYEALARWHHPRMGDVHAEAFIKALEGTPVLGALTGFVVQQVLDDVLHLDADRICRIAVNISPAELEQTNVIDLLVRAAAALPPNLALSVELTERYDMNDSRLTRQSLERINRAGIKLALDDFGTHRSNVDLLQQISFDFLKIDRRFISQLNSEETSLLKAMLDIARHFGLEVIAEGVETAAQHHTLLGAGVEFGQGYLYGRPTRAQDSLVLATSPAVSPAKKRILMPVCK
jgi:c-di-GMP phosphodiesterase